MCGSVRNINFYALLHVLYYCDSNLHDDYVHACAHNSHDRLHRVYDHGLDDQVHDDRSDCRVLQY